MAFTVQFKNRPTEQWYVNDIKPPHAFLDEVKWFAADGDELQKIRAQFLNIPIRNGNHTSWTGELANFLFRNL